MRKSQSRSQIVQSKELLDWRKHRNICFKLQLSAINQKSKNVSDFGDKTSRKNL